MYSFCLNLSKDVEASARERKASAKSYLYGRIVYRLRTVLGRDASLWFALEETEHLAQFIAVGILGQCASDAIRLGPTLSR